MLLFFPANNIRRGDYGLRHYNNNNHNSIRVNQAVNQANSCSTTSSSPPPVMTRSPNTDQNVVAMKAEAEAAVALYA